MYSVFSSLRIKDERVFRMTSDDFFTGRKRMLVTHGISVGLVDGLHTYEQSLRDVLNALEHLRPNGVILMHDCNPTTEFVAAPATSIDEMIKRDILGWDGSWSGDVWKAVVHLRSLRDDVNVFVLDCDTGIGVVTKGLPSDPLAFSEAEISAMDFDFLVSRRRELLGLQPESYFWEFLNQHRTLAITQVVF